MSKKNYQTYPSKDDEEKITNEKQVSLSPLSLKEAIAAELMVKLKQKEEKAEEKKESKPDN